MFNTEKYHLNLIYTTQNVTYRSEGVDSSLSGLSDLLLDLSRLLSRLDAILIQKYNVYECSDILLCSTDYNSLARACHDRRAQV